MGNNNNRDNINNFGYETIINVDSSRIKKLSSDMDVSTVCEYLIADWITFEDFENFITHNLSFLNKTETGGERRTLISYLISKNEHNDKTVRYVDLLLEHSKKQFENGLLPEEFIQQLFINTYYDIKWVRYLIEKGFDINAKNTSGDNVFGHIAGYDNNSNKIWLERLKDWILYLKNSGADINSKNIEDNTALHIACKNKDRNNVIEQFLGIGADPNIKDIDGCTSLMLTIREFLSIAKMNEMLKFGANISIRCKNDWRALNYAIRNGIHSIEHTDRLLQLNPHVLDLYLGGDNMLIKFFEEINLEIFNCSCCNLHIDVKIRLIISIIRKFVELGININHKNSQGKTAIHMMIDNKFIYRKIFKNTIRLMTNPELQTYEKLSLFSYTVLKLKEARLTVKAEEKILFILKCLLDVPVVLTRKDMDNMSDVLSYLNKHRRLRLDIDLLFKETMHLYNIQKMSNK